MAADIQYSKLGMGRQLNQMVMAGSHDAGITEGKSNVKTQSVDIYEQAVAGVRLFDLRIAGQALEDGVLGKQAELKAYHSAIQKKSKADVHLKDLGQQVNLTTSKLKGGDFGMGLQKMLTDAKRFIDDNSNEFLILKFDKCSNYKLIAKACIRFLGDRIFTGKGNLNTKKISELAGHVIVVFSTKGLLEARSEYSAKTGILGVESGGGFDPDFDGMQYVGKGGTSIFLPIFKIAQNKSTQAKLMKKGGDGDPNMLGMMYWTTTGVLESIKKRNDSMWTANKESALRKLWSNGLSKSIESRLTKNIDPTSDSAGGMLKAFMPNFVMIDFADKDKCKTIYDLNSVAAVALTSAAKNVGM